MSQNKIKKSRSETETGHETALTEHTFSSTALTGKMMAHPTNAFLEKQSTTALFQTRLRNVEITAQLT